MASTAAKNLASTIIKELTDTTDLNQFDRKTVAYYTVATHSISSFDAFGIVTLLGETNTGKNSVIQAMRHWGFCSRDPLVLRGVRLPILRDYLIETQRQLAIIDEADSMMDDVNFEELLKCRSRREQGQILLNRANENGKGYRRQDENIYGPLVVHRQAPFISASLATRCITIHTKPNLDRLYRKPATGFKHTRINLKLEPVEIDGAPRIVENWLPISSVATAIDDIDYIVELTNKLAEESVEMIREAQASEPTRIVLDGALALSLENDTWNTKRWRVKELSEWIWENHAISLNPQQVGRVLRSYHLQTIKSHGTYVANIQPAQLLHALNSANCTDDEMYDKLCEIVSTRSTRSTRKPAKLWDAGGPG